MDFSVLFTVFGILFLGELGDKTQLIVFNLSLQHEKSWKVGLGATLGFAAIVTLGVIIGAVATEFVPLTILSYISGAVFIVIGCLGLARIKQMWAEHKLSKTSTGDCGEGTGAENDGEQGEDLSTRNDAPKNQKRWRKNPILAGFGFIFLMELGDKTQILTITLAVTYPLVEVWLGSFFALSFLAWIGAFFGGFIARKVPKFHLNVLSSAIFMIIGLLLILFP